MIYLKGIAVSNNLTLFITDSFYSKIYYMTWNQSNKYNKEEEL